MSSFVSFGRPTVPAQRASFAGPLAAGLVSPPDAAEATALVKEVRADLGVAGATATVVRFVVDGQIAAELTVPASAASAAAQVAVLVPKNARRQWQVVSAGLGAADLVCQARS
jgi:hypothetical protein